MKKKRTLSKKDNPWAVGAAYSELQRTDKILAVTELALKNATGETIPRTISAACEMIDELRADLDGIRGRFEKEWPELVSD